MLERCEQYEDAMYHKYRQAAFFPWCSVPPDPIAPPLPHY